MPWAAPSQNAQLLLLTTLLAHMSPRALATAPPRTPPPSPPPAPPPCLDKFGELWCKELRNAGHCFESSTNMVYQRDCRWTCGTCHQPPSPPSPQPYPPNAAPEPPSPLPPYQPNAAPRPPPPSPPFRPPLSPRMPPSPSRPPLPPYAGDASFGLGVLIGSIIFFTCSVGGLLLIRNTVYRYDEKEDRRRAQQYIDYLAQTQGTAASEGATRGFSLTLPSLWGA